MLNALRSAIERTTESVSVERAWPPYSCENVMEGGGGGHAPVKEAKVKEEENGADDDDDDDDHKIISDQA